MPKILAVVTAQIHHEDEVLNKLQSMKEIKRVVSSFDGNITIEVKKHKLDELNEIMKKIQQIEFCSLKERWYI